MHNRNPEKDFVVEEENPLMRC